MAKRNPRITAAWRPDFGIAIGELQLLIADATHDILTDDPDAEIVESFISPAEEGMVLTVLYSYPVHDIGVHREYDIYTVAM